LDEIGSDLRCKTDGRLHLVFIKEEEEEEKEEDDTRSITDTFNSSSEPTTSSTGIPRSKISMIRYSHSN